MGERDVCRARYEDGVPLEEIPIATHIVRVKDDPDDDAWPECDVCAALARQYPELTVEPIA